MNKKYLALGLTAVLLSACGGGGSSTKHNDGKGDIDLKDYFPNTSMTKTYELIERDGDDVFKTHYENLIEVKGNVITTTDEDGDVEKTTFTDTNITIIPEQGVSTTMYRHVDIGDTIISEKGNETREEDIGKVTSDISMTCKIKSKEDKFEKGDNIYKGDLLKIECISEGEIIYDIKPSLMVHLKDLNGSHPYYDSSYLYLKKDLGEIAEINEDCIPDEKLDIVNDKKSGKDCSQVQYEYDFYLP